MARRFVLTRRMLRDALAYLERSHYSDGRSDKECAECKRAHAIRRELEALDALEKEVN